MDYYLVLVCYVSYIFFLKMKKGNYQDYVFY